MSEPPARCLLLIWLVLLSACSRDVVVSTVLDDTGGLRPGDKVYLESREVGAVHSIEVTEREPGFTVRLGLNPEHAGLVQENAVAYVPLQGPPLLMLRNPTEKAGPVAPGGRLKGLSPFEVALWQASDAAAAASSLIDQFAGDVDAYLESEEWAETRDRIESEIAELAAESEDAAERVAEALESLVESLTAGPDQAAQRPEEEAESPLTP